MCVFLSVCVCVRVCHSGKIVSVFGNGLKVVLNQVFACGDRLLCVCVCVFQCEIWPFQRCEVEVVGILALQDYTGDKSILCNDPRSIRVVFRIPDIETDFIALMNTNTIRLGF